MNMRFPKTVCLCAVLLSSMAGTASAATVTNIYHANRVFRPVTTTISGTPTLYQVYTMAGQLTDVVGPTNVIVDTNATFAVEYESLALGYGSPGEAWSAVASNYICNTQIHTNKTYDNAGWVKGTHPAYGTWGGFLWLLQNHVAFRTSPTNVWVSPYGVTNYIAQVLVGSIGDYPPMTNIVDVGPTNWNGDLPTTYLGSGATTDTTCRADFTAYYQLFGVQLRFADPDGSNWPDLDEKKVILSDRCTRIKLKVTPQMPDLPSIFNTLGTTLKIKTSGTAPNGYDFTLTAQNTTLVQEDGSSEMRVSITRDQLKTLGVLPNQEVDAVTEKAWLDHGSSNPSDSSNLADGNAFENGLSAETRGQSTSYGNLESTPPNGPIDKTFFIAAGREIITVEYGAFVSHKRQAMNQADYFYYSGHGSHANATLCGGEFGPSDVTGYWDKDLDCVIIAGCAVLDVKDYRAQSFSLGTWLQWYSAGGAWSPGAQWESAGPKYFLGYNWTAPLDNQGSSGIASTFLTALSGGASVVEAWKEANDLGIGRNACAIDVSSNPHVYWYWDETSEAAVWTNVMKAGGSW